MNYDEHPIDRIYVDWANTLDASNENSKQVIGRLLTAMAHLRYSMSVGVSEFGPLIDSSKKWAFYGKEYPKTDFEIGKHEFNDAEFKRMTDFVFYDSNLKLLHGVMGLVTESLELLSLLNDAMFGNSQTPQLIDRDKLIEECGDVLWYMAVCARYLGLETLDELMAANKMKLTARYGNKWNKAGAVERPKD
mgnify:CR=1 FL=1